MKQYSVHVAYILTGLNVQRVRIPAPPSTGASQYYQGHQGLEDFKRRFRRVTKRIVVQHSQIVFNNKIILYTLYKQIKCFFSKSCQIYFQP